MLVQSSIRQGSQPRSAPSSVLRDPCSPRQNRLLAALPDAEYARLLPYLVPVPLPLGVDLHRAGDREEHLYFVTAGLVSRYYVLADGSSIGFSLTGSEGVIGIAGFLGGTSTPNSATVQSAGSAYRMPLSRLSSNFDQDSALTHLLLRYIQALITQTTLNAVCNRFHSVEQQLSRLILSCLDRLRSEELAITHERLAALLGVRREAVSGVARALHTAGLIRCGRSHIDVLSRAELESRACECYGVINREYRRLLPAYDDEEQFLAGS